MKKKIIIWLSAVFFIFTAAAPAFAMDQGNKRKGKYIYRKVYKSCFDRGVVDSQTPPLGPNAKTQSQWTQTFDNREFGQFGCQEEWSALSDEDLTDIYTYLHAHASDSPTPLSCK